MRNMSFAMTIDALLEGRKDVTRRIGWQHLRPGDRLCAVAKAMGLRKGEKLRRLARLRVVSVRRERLADVTSQDVVREGYPNLSANEFIQKLEEALRCSENDEVTRIEFVVEERLEEPERRGNPCP